MSYGDKLRKLLEPFNNSLKENDMEIVFQGGEPTPIGTTSVHIKMYRGEPKRDYNLLLDVEFILSAPDVVLKELIALRDRSEAKRDER